VYVDERLASKGISALVCIKTTLESLPSLATVLDDMIRVEEPVINMETEDVNDDRTYKTYRTDRTSLLVGLGSGDLINPCQNQLLKAIYFSLSQPVLQEVLNAVIDVFTDTTAYTRSPNAMRHQECFALKCEENGMMSVLRKAFLANVDDIYKKADEYAEVYGFQVSVRYSSGRGYYLSVPADVAMNLPQVFLQPAKSGRFVNCTTEEISSLNSRAKDNVHDILLMTHDRIQEVLDIARSNYDAIASMCDAIALLDMCHSFADNVTLT
jgi:DNA mismatch repair protein MSH4